MTSELICYGGEVCLLDTDDFNKLNNNKWYFDGRYVYRSKIFEDGVRRVTRIHREVLNNPLKLKIDHINGNPLDNRKENLRIATTSQNACNKKKVSTPSSSKYKGVTYRKERGSWESSIKHDNRNFHIGNWENEEDAAMAYNDCAYRMFGEYARINVIENQKEHSDYMSRKKTNLNNQYARRKVK